MYENPGRGPGHPLHHAANAHVHLAFKGYAGVDSYANEYD